MHNTRTVDQPAELLSYLFAAWPDAKKKQVRTWLKHEAVTINGHVSTQFNHPLKPGDVVAIRTDRHAVPGTVLTSGMKIHFEDSSLIVIEKPANLLSIASHAEEQKTAYYLLNEYLRRGDQFSRERIWIVHRLDRETSGLMVFARTAQAKAALQTNWDTAEKRYFAVVEGRLPESRGTFKSWLDESNPFRVFSVPRAPGAHHAVTHYRALKQGKGRTLVELTLETGRRHQIRVHLKDAGCPIAGDSKYGAQTDPARRLCLHACALAIAHPVTGKRLFFESPLPAELARIV